MSLPPTGTVTFLFTDIEGSTRLWESSPDEMRPALARHDDLLRQNIENHSGIVFKTIGDAFCAAFPTAPDALAAALAAQLALAAEPWHTERPLRVRMALHTGTAEERGGDYFGQPLNRVARLVAAGHGGQTLLSDVTQGLVQDGLPPQAAIQDIGQHRLKDLGRPAQVFQLLHPALPTKFPPLSSLNNPALPNNLPQQPTSFIGREKQIDDVKVLLGKSRLLTLTGAGGSGKTRLSLQVAADLLDGDGDGVWFVELAALTDPALVSQAAADVLGVKEQAGKPIQQTLVAALKPKRLLIVLDNCEHLVAACASLAADLLRNCPDVRILSSSREALNISGEQTYRVPSLTLPDPKLIQSIEALSLSVEALSLSEAVRLFIERAQSVQPSFMVTNRNAAAVAAVCSRLDGIPLALELAAVRVRSLSVEEVNARLDNRFRLLTGGSRTALPRQQTLRALIDWSHDLLSDQEKRLLRRLSVFSGGWTLAAAEAACAGGGIDEIEVVDLLTGLVDKSLAIAEERSSDMRYRLLETVRQYAGDRLSECGEQEAVQGKVAEWALTLAEQAEPYLWGPEQGEWLSRLEVEHDNLRASLLWYGQVPTVGAEDSNAKDSNAKDSNKGLRLAGALWRFWEVHGHFSEGRQWLGVALARAEPRTVGHEIDGHEIDGLDATGMPEASAGRVKALSGRGKLLLGAGRLAYHQGEYAAARALNEEGLAIHRRLGDQKSIASGLNNLGLIALNQGDRTAAQALYKESLAIVREQGNQGGIAILLNNLGLMSFEQGDYAAARLLHEESLAIQRLLGNRSGIAYSLLNLGSVSCEQGDQAAARTSYEESLTIFRELGDRLLIANSLNGLGAVTSSQGDYAASWAFYAESMMIQRQLGDQHGLAYGLEGMADVARGQGRPSRAAQLIGAATFLRETIGNPLPTPGQKELERTLTAARAALGAEVFAVDSARGRAMTLAQAVEFALTDES